MTISLLKPSVFWPMHASLVTVAVVSFGCGNGEGAKPDAGAVETIGEPEYDEFLQGQLTRGARECEFATPTSSPTGCDELDSQLDAYVSAEGVGTLDTLSEALGGAKDDKARMAGWLLFARFPPKVIPELAEDPAKLPLGAVVRLIEAATKGATAERGAALWMPVVVQLGHIKGRHEDVAALVNGIKDPVVKGAAASYLLRFGRLAAFPTVQELAKSKDDAVRLGALSAPSKMWKMTKEEEEAVCPWLKGFVGVEGTRVVADGLLRCGRGEVNAVLDEAEKRAKKEFVGPFAFAIRDMCLDSVIDKPKNDPDTKQCERGRTIFFDIVEDKKRSAEERAFALDALTWGWRTETSLAFARQKRKERNKLLAETAVRVVKRLEKQLGVEGREE